MNNPTTPIANMKEETARLTSSSANVNSNTSTKPQVFQNTTNLSNRVLAKPISKLQLSTTPTNSVKMNKQIVPHMTSMPKRAHTLNTKTKHRLELIDRSFTLYQPKYNISSNDKSYLITDLFAESADFLFKFNNQISNLKNFTISNSSILVKKLNFLIEFIQINLKAPLNSSQLFGKTTNQNSSVQSFLFHMERIEHVTKRLNDEILKLINYLLDTKNYFSIVQKPIATYSNMSIIDLICLSFKICFELFLFRTSFFLLSSNMKNKYEIDSTLFKKINKIKEQFFFLIIQLLQSIVFASNNKYASNINQIRSILLQKYAK